MRSIDYYDKYGQAFFDRTINVDMSHNAAKFLRLLPSGGYIVDAGCGSGRDTKHFLDKGYKVLAFDASLEMVKRSSLLTGQKTLHQTFSSLNPADTFDGVWANASLLHVPYGEQYHVFDTFYAALKCDGILYGSFKYGNSHRVVTERDFYDHTEQTLSTVLQEKFHLLETWQSPDTGRAASGAKKWLNFLARKVTINDSGL